MSDESQLQIRPSDGESSLSLSKARSGLVARGRRDAATLAVPCNKCGDRKELVFAGCVCADCSDALDKEWAGSTATDWLLTKLGGNPLSASEFVYSNTTYADVKRYWGSPPAELTLGFLQNRQPTPEEIAQPRSPSFRSEIRPANPEEVAAYKQSHREWSIAADTDQLIRETCARLGIGEQGEPQRVEETAEEIAGGLRELGWFDELARMKREDSDALQAIDDVRLLEMVLAVRK